MVLLKYLPEELAHRLEDDSSQLSFCDSVSRCVTSYRNTRKYLKDRSIVSSSTEYSVPESIELNCKRLKA